MAMAYEKAKKFLCYGFNPPIPERHPKKFYGDLRKLRVELQDLVDMVARAKTGDINLDDHLIYINKTFIDIGELIESIKQQENDSDTIRHIRNIWEQIAFNMDLLSPSSEPDEAAYLKFLTLLEDQVREMVLYIGFKTIPERINAWLKSTHPGFVLPFHSLFDDELMSDADRQKVLEYISWKPKSIEGGLVDSESGLIFRYPDCKIERTLRNLSLAVVFAVISYLLFVFGADVVASAIATPDNAVVAENFGHMLSGWLALIAGVLVNALVFRVKQQRISGVSPILPMSVWSYYLSSRTGGIVFKLTLALVAYISLRVTLEPGEFDLGLAFLVGYSLNSFIGIFSTSLDAKAAAHMSRLQQRWSDKKQSKMS